MSEDARAARRRVRREGRVIALERALTPSRAVKYEQWQAACKRMGVPVTTESRFEFLSDLVEDITS